MLAPEQRKLAAEFLGSFLVVFVVCSNYSAGASNPDLAVFGPTSIALVYAAMSYILKDVSGGLLNPAVSVAMVLKGEVGRGEGLKMIVAQCAGGAAAGAATLFLYGWNSDANIIEPHDAGFLLGAPLVEMLYTCLLCFVYLNVNVARNKASFSGLAVGFVFIAGGVGGKYVSGAAYNPAVALGVQLMGTNLKSVMLPIYVAAEVAGAILAVVLYHVIRKNETMGEDQELTRGFLTKAVTGLSGQFDSEDSCEFLGTLFVTLTITLNQIAAEMSHGAAGKIWSNAAAYISVMYALSDCSGGLFNPAITATYFVRFYGTGCGIDDSGKCSEIKGEIQRLVDFQQSKKETIKYLAYQFIGAAAGTGLTILVWLGEAPTAGVWPVASITPGTYTDAAGEKHSYSVWQAMFAEFYGSFLICFAMLVMMMSKEQKSDFGPFVVGGCVIAAGYAFGPLSGAIFNPAVAVSSAVLSKLQALYTLAPVLYLLGQVLGGVAAGVVFRFVTHVDEMNPLSQSLLPVLP